MQEKREIFGRKSRKLPGIKDPQSDPDKYRSVEDQKNEKRRIRVAVVPITYYKSTKLERALERLFVEVDKAYKDGADILVLSDRGVDENHMAIPSLLAVSAVHQHLVATKKQTSLSLILESGEPREVHHFATLLGYGACAVNPYLALDTIHELIEEEMLDKDYMRQWRIIHWRSCTES